MAVSKPVWTRQKLKCPIFGHPKQLSDLNLPTYCDIMKYYLYIRHELKLDATSKEPTVSEILDSLITKVESIWSKASIPTVSRLRMLQMGKSYHEKYKGILKSISRKGTKNFDSVIASFLNDSKRLFDVAACKCKVFSECRCEKRKKVPKHEQDFLLDQRTVRRMSISGVDKVLSKVLIRREERKQQVMQQQLQYNQKLDVIDTRKSENVVVQSDPIQTSKGNITYNPEEPSTSSSSLGSTTCESEQMRVELPTVASICDRTAVSDRVAAAIASAVLKDVGMITQEDKSKVIDRMKIRRERAKNRTKEILSSFNQIGENKGLFFDGRKDKTIVQEKKGNKFYKKVVIEEHISLVKEPDSFFLGHVTPAFGTGEAIKDSITAYFDRNNHLNISTITAIGCDGTSVNTGVNNGVIALLEKDLNRPLQWLICLFHCNELPLRHLFRELDGKTKGPNEFGGVLGKQLENCNELPVVKFSPIPHNLPELETEEDLSTDQKYLFEMCTSISSGTCSPDLSLKKPGKLAHSRWLTLASRLLRLYVGTENPSDNLKTLTEYVLKVYAPIWFYIKLKPSCMNGSKHLWRLIQFSRYLSEHHLKIIDPVIQRNGYYAHPENLLICMLSDERKHVRELGLRRLLKARLEQMNGVRKFVVPNLNLNAQDFTDMIAWKNITITEPPMTKHVSDEDLKRYIKEIKDPNYQLQSIDFPRFPCHTQAVERVIKLVTESSLCVCGSEARDGFIKAKIASQKMMPKFETKKNFM